jgi:GT2 family glycosyltransferase
MAERKHVAPLVSIITVHFNQVEATLALLRSVRHLTYPNVETLVVDNGSRQAPLNPAWVEPFPRTRLLVSAENLGFAGGNNLALRRAKGEFLLLVNNDTELTPNLIEELLAPMRADPTVGVVCPKIRYFHHPDRIQYAGYRPLNAYTGQTTAFGRGEVDTGQYDRSGPTAFAHGAAMMVRRAALEKAGLMNERYFLYYEELDWSHQIRRVGYQIYYQASALIYHKESLSVGKASPQKVYYLTRNRILFMRRCTPAGQRAVFTLYFLLAALPKHLLVYGIRGQTAYLNAFLKGIFWNLTHSPA